MDGFVFIYLFRNFRDRRDAERAECDVDDAVCAEDDNEPDDAPHNRAATLLPLPLVPRSLDEFEYAPDEDDERARREKQDYRINNLHDDLREKFVENGWNFPGHLPSGSALPL